MTLVARLGLRSIEVARLELRDVDWRAGELVVRGKARRQDRLPLPAEAGAALAGYLTRGRALAGARRLFLTYRAPRGPIRADLIGDVVERACRRAGLPRVGPHRLRHALAAELQRRGVASDATFRVRREDGAVRGDCPGTAGRPTRRQSEPAGQDGRDRTVLRQVPGCCAHSGCIRRKHDAAKATKKRTDEGRCHYRPVVKRTHSAWLVNRSLPVQFPPRRWAGRDQSGAPSPGSGHHRPVCQG